MLLTQPLKRKYTKRPKKKKKKEVREKEKEKRCAPSKEKVYPKKLQP